MSAKLVVKDPCYQFLHDLTPTGTLGNKLVCEIQRLLRELHDAKCTKETLDAIRRAPDTWMLLAHTDEPNPVIIGMATLIFLPPSLSSVRRAFIDHVAVLPEFRRKGIAERLCRELLARASIRGYKRVELTSRYSNVNAHALYDKMGFERRETQVFRYEKL